MPLLKLTTPSLYHVQIWICNHCLCAFIVWAYLLAIGFYWTYSWLVSVRFYFVHILLNQLLHTWLRLSWLHSQRFDLVHLFMGESCSG